MNERLRNIVIPVTGIFLVCAVILLLVHKLTEKTISENAREFELGSIRDLMTLHHGNNLLNDFIVLEDASMISGSYPLHVYRARQGDQIVGVVFRPVMTEGYNGPVELAIAISADNTVLGVNTVRHRETSGLGAEIDRENSNWLSVFTGVNSGNMQPPDWNVRAQGGKFDQISGATITSRAIIKAVQKTLDFHHAYHDRLYAE